MFRPLVGLIVIAVVFSVVEALAPSDAPRRTLWARRVDLGWWLLQPLAKAFARGVVVVLVGLPLVALGLAGDGAPYTGFGPLSELPTWLQAGLVLLGADAVGYLSHRFLFHGPLWRWHAIHHAPEQLDWASASRVHPVNTLVNQVVHTVPLVALGFDPTAVVGAVPWLAGWALLLHTDVTWSFGPLRHLVATPRFHRWHHARGAAVNFAGLFPVLDRLSGTYHLPDAGPTELGVDDPVPPGLLGGLIWPFRSQAPQGRQAAIVAE